MLCDRTATALVQDLQNGALRAETLMEATLARISERNPELNAIVALRPAEDLMAEARAADAVPVAERGALHGIPMAIKDLANARGLVTSQGSPILAGQVAETDDIFVARLRAAGVIVIGKTNTPEFGLGSHTYNPVYGPTGNVIDPTRSAGGSSGGAAVALAAGMVPLADGSDMMGSLRNPAGWNAVYGLRPTWGWVPSEPAGDMFLHPLSTNGPMARTPADLALLLDVMAGGDARLPLHRGARPVQPLRSDAPLRLGWLGDWGGAYPMEPGVLETCEAALARFEALGHSVTRVASPFPAEKLWQSWTTLRSFAVAAGLRPLLAQRDQLKAAACWELERGMSFAAAEIQAASDLRAAWMRAAARMFAQYDAVLLPTAQCWPFPVDWTHPQQIAGVEMDSYHRWMEVVVPASLIGLPALAVPAGRGAAGLPMGMQIIGAHNSDAQLLGLAAAYHAAAS
ncbi:amidase [Epibacterium sp. MM17-32]|uniref:amidase n=1 Tax=Epibacterium sp. MM17-32 TaxID=2917734 RepID=UPI001EF45085|nr:amidase [Epibacterium sp. MM17-32]MCG7626195.1 amidase [Epibacterium sp. MM17-32]